MTDEDLPTQKRALRADAERNRAKLLATAKAAFSENGYRASLDDIARKAGMGAGTLYRHFPNRDALIEAVYLNESQQLLDAAKALSKAYVPLQALREWLRLFVDYVATKRFLAEAIGSLASGPGALQASSNALVSEALDLLVGCAIASGETLSKVEPLSLLWALAAVANSGVPEAHQQAKQLVDVLLDGLRPPR